MSETADFPSMTGLPPGILPIPKLLLDLSGLFNYDSR